MRLFVLGTILVVSVQICQSQTTNINTQSKVTVAAFTKGKDYRLMDTLTVAHLSSYIKDERKISVDSSMLLTKLVEQIKANGTQHITKCFIPRHSINFYKDDKLVKFILVCFECDGVRFSDGTDTPVKKANKRELQMKKLQKYFWIK